jgi:hypothetical protein
MLSVLKEIPKTVQKVSVSVPESVKKPEKGTRLIKDAPIWKERSQPGDIVIDSRSECMDILHKLEGLYDVVDSYIEPDHVKRHLPRAFGDVSKIFEVKLPDRKRLAGLMTYRVANQFVCRNFEYLTDLELLTR